MVKIDPVSRNCKTCQKAFTAEYSNEIYCSECWNKRSFAYSSKKEPEFDECLGDNCSYYSKLQKVKKKLKNWILLLSKYE